MTARLLRGLFSSAPGILHLTGERLSFTAISSGTLWGLQLRTLEEMARQQGLVDGLRRDTGVGSRLLK
jgi:hypothetical protein